MSQPSPPAVSQALARPYRGLGLPCRGRRAPCRRRYPCGVSWPDWPCRKTPQLDSPPQSQYTNLYCNTITSATRFLCHNTLQCIVIQTSTIQPQYNRRLAIQFIHCTPNLQYTSPIAIQFSSHSNPSLAIQFQQPSPLAIHLILQYKPSQPTLPKPKSQYSSFYHNTIRQ